MANSFAMKMFVVRLLFVVLSMVALAAAQDIIPLYPGPAPDYQTTAGQRKPPSSKSPDYCFLLKA
jgi:hypothetical protein